MSAPCSSSRVPGRPQRHQFPIQFDGDAPAHADDHGFAVHGFQPVLEVLHQIAGDEFEAVVGADHGFELRPFALELLLALDFLALGRLFELGIDFRPLGLVQLQPGQAALVVDGHRGPIRDRPLDVVDADVVAEHRPGVLIAEFQRRAGKADKRGVGQGVAQMPREAVDEVVLAAVRLVGDDHNVAALREHRMPVTPFLGEKLLNRREHHAARGDGELSAQVGAIRGLHRRLTQQVAAAGEGAEQLIVEVVAVGEHDDGGVLQHRIEDDPAGIERHRQALARTLRVPDHAHPPVALFASRLAFGIEGAVAVAHPVAAGRAPRFLHRHVDRVELMVTRHLLDELAAAQVLEDDEMPQQIEEATLIEHTLDQHPQLGQKSRRQRFPADGPPGLEPFAPGAQRADTSLGAVRHDQRGVIVE